MRKATKETFYLMIGSFFGAFVSLTVELLNFDINNKWSWFMFIITIFVLFLLARWLLNIFYKVTTPRKKLKQKNK